MSMPWFRDTWPSSRAISINVEGPSRSIWSNAIRVMAGQASGARDHIRRVQTPSSRPTSSITAMSTLASSRKARNAARVATLEERKLWPGVEGDAEKSGEFGVADGFSVEPNALGETTEVRRRVESSLLPLSARNALHHRRDAALAVRASHVHGGKGSLRVAHARARRFHGVESQPHSEWNACIQAGEDVNRCRAANAKNVVGRWPDRQGLSRSRHRLRPVTCPLPASSLVLAPARERVVPELGPRVCTASQSPGVQAMGDGHMLDILVVDDDATVRESIVEALASAGHVVTEASDGEAALALCLSRDFHVVVSDVTLPKLDGLALFRRLRLHSPGTEVVLMTSFATSTEAIRCLCEGAFEYIAKPFDPDDFARSIVGLIVERRSLRAQWRRPWIHL